MNNKNEFYNLFTSLVDKNRLAVNFLRGFDYRNNFLRMYELINEVNDSVDCELEIVSAFDIESEDEYTNTFRKVTLSYDVELLETLNALIKNDKRFKSFKVKELNKKKKNSHCIEIIFTENENCED